MMMKGGSYVPENRRRLDKVILKTHYFPQLLVIRRRKGIVDKGSDENYDFHT